MARKQHYPHQTCARIGDDHRRTLNAILRRLKRERGAVQTDADGYCWLLEQDFAKAFAKGPE